MSAQRGGLCEVNFALGKSPKIRKPGKIGKKYGNNAENEGEALKEEYQRNRERRDKAERQNLFDHEKNEEKMRETRKQQTRGTP